jgi:hypothetical protein
MSDPLSGLLSDIEGAAVDVASAVGGVVVIKSNLLPDITIAPPSSSSSSSGPSAWLNSVGQFALSVIQPAVYVGALGQQTEVAAPAGEPTEGLWIVALVVVALVWVISLALAVRLLGGSS